MRHTASCKLYRSCRDSGLGIDVSAILSEFRRRTSRVRGVLPIMRLEQRPKDDRAYQDEATTSV
jgi:hypothetical protein